jgi:adenine-specific DNA-methyltransferase
MATGVSRSTNHNLILPSCEPDLPNGNGGITINYAGKTPQEEILKFEPDCQFLCSGFNKIASKNSLFWGDNFAALKHLISNKIRVNLVYLDPPYLTGQNFQSRKQEHAYCDSMDEVSYIEFMRRRIVLIRELMADDASIYLHIGHQMVATVKIVMDEVFGRNCFKNLIIRKKCSSKNYTRKQYPNLNDYILFYTKSASYTWNHPGEMPDENWIEKEYPKIETDGRRYKLVPIHAPGVRNGDTGQPWRGMMPPPGKHWQFKTNTLDEFDEKGEIHWSKTGNPRRKVYFTDETKLTKTDYWDNYRDAHHQSIKITGYPTEKNFEMLKLIVQTSSNPGDLVLDPFAGSGTTLHAADVLGRGWIGIDNSSVAIETILTRLKYGLKPMGSYNEKKKQMLSQALLTTPFDFFYDSRLKQCASFEKINEFLK